jgi:hypothetical protein
MTKQVGQEIPQDILEQIQQNSKRKNEIQNKGAFNKKIQQRDAFLMAQIKSYIDEKFENIKDILIDLEDCQLNIKTIAYLLGNSGAFTEDEFFNAHKIMVEETQLIKEDGSIDGTVEASMFNCKNK